MAYRSLSDDLLDWDQGKLSYERAVEMAQRLLDERLIVIAKPEGHAVYQFSADVAVDLAKFVVHLVLKGVVKCPPTAALDAR